MKKRKKLVLLTGISGSGKTTVENILVKDYNYTEVTNFTTRKPRGEREGVKGVDKEGDFIGERIKYVFLSKEQILNKYEKGELLEFTQSYNGQMYGISKFLPKSDSDVYIAVVDCAGRSQIEQKASIDEEFKELDLIKIFLDIPKEEQVKRLIKRGNVDSKELKERIKDYEYYYASPGTYELNGKLSPQKLAKEINQIVNG